MNPSVGILKCAAKTATKSTHRYKVGAVVFRHKSIISSGFNGNRYIRIHPKYQKYTHSCHAEQNAIVGLDWSKLNGMSIVVVRLKKNGDFGMAMPCPKCRILLQHVGIKNAYYTNSYGRLEHIKIGKHRNLFFNASF